MENQQRQPIQAPPAGTPERVVSGKPMEITITLPTNAYFVSGIRDFTLGLIRNMTEFSEQWAFRFQSVVDELCNNAIEHGSKQGDNIVITFINHPKESIEIIVRDSGSGKAKMSASELNRIVKERTDPHYVHIGIRGRGLSKIVAEWTDELVFSDTETGGIEARVKKYLKDPNLPQQTGNPLENPTHLVLNV
ncbi:ATP-binding protein [Patescibacteria group bacterium]|nr:ATP-binding protein [Patescibacteria group bacterium]MBU1702927.1 ATP-binding protein [Patescibacteria group bacterium]MBU1953483.1 ATP-binding protein [Patescibacteria group bacterium]